MTRLPGASWLPEGAVTNSPPVLTMALPMATRSVAPPSCANAGTANSRVARAAAIRVRVLFMDSFQFDSGETGDVALQYRLRQVRAARNVCFPDLASFISGMRQFCEVAIQPH